MKLEDLYKYIKENLLFFFCMLLTFVLILFSTKDSYFTKGDEGKHLLNVSYLIKNGLTMGYFNDYYGAAGPFFPILHYFLYPITDLEPNLVRQFNFIFLLFCIYIIQKQSKYFNGTRILFIPVVLICSMYALTEMPALLLTFLGLYILQRSDKVRILDFIMAGFLIGLSSAFRWGLIPAVGIYAIWIIFFLRIRILSKLVIIIATICVPLFLIITWQGLYPPSVQNSPDFGTFLFAYDNFFKSTMILFVLIFILNPAFVMDIVISNYKKYIQLLVITLFFNFSFKIMVFFPGESIINFIGLKNNIIGLLFGSIAIAITFIISNIMLKLKDVSDNRYKYFAIINIIIILLSTIKVNYIFSTRYALMTLPFLVMLMDFPYRKVKYDNLVLLSSYIVGIFGYFAFKEIY